MLRRFLLVFMLLVLPLTACGTDSTRPDDQTYIVVTTSIWADVLRELDTAGEWEVDVLIPRGADPHDYAPSSEQVAMINRADLVIANGLGLEEGLEDALEAAIEDGVEVLFLAPALSPLPFGEHDEHTEDEEHTEDDEHAEDEHEHELDPHVWTDPLRVADAARLIADRLGGDGLDDFVSRMESLHETITERASELSEKRLITNHDSLGYFADRYGFEVLGTVLGSGSTTSEPSSRELAALLDVMAETGITTIFVDAGTSDAVAAAVVGEFGEDGRVVHLSIGSLGSHDSLESMLSANAEQIVSTLGGSDAVAP